MKGLDPAAIAENCRNLEGPVVIHFRWATAGGKNPVLCHPFPISEAGKPKLYGSADAVLFHNGHWSGYEQFAADNALALEGPVSDSRVIAVGTWIGGFDWLRTVPGRFAVLTTAGYSLFGDWVKRGGVHYSNLNWVRQRYPEPPRRTEPVQLTLSHRPYGRGISLVEEAMACFGD